MRPSFYQISSIDHHQTSFNSIRPLNNLLQSPSKSQTEAGDSASKDRFQQLRARCQFQLYNLAIRPMGKFYGPEQQSMKTLQVIYELARLRKKDLQFRDQCTDRLTKMESERNQFKKTSQTLKRELQSLNKMNGALQNRMQQQKGSQNSQIDKLKADFVEQGKVKAKLERNNQLLSVQIKKKENQITKIKEQFRKPQKALPKNSFQVVASLKPFKYSDLDSDAAFYSLAKKKLQSRINQLESEHVQLRKALQFILEETDSLLISLRHFTSKSLPSQKISPYVPMSKAKCQIQLLFKHQLDQIKSILKQHFSRPSKPHSSSDLRSKPNLQEDVDSQSQVSVISSISRIPQAKCRSKEELKYWDDILSKDI